MAVSKYFLEDLPTKEDEELYQMLARPGDFEPDAILAASEELKRRNIPAETASKFEKDAILKASLVEIDRQKRTNTSKSYSLFPDIAIVQFIFRVCFRWLKD